jgi:tRNA threonylcarbamoyladenosine biosynthesis protein TsaE
LSLFHVDLYRLESIGQALAIGIEDYLNGSGVTVIEWAEKIESLLPERARRIRIRSLGENARHIEVV